MLKFEPIGAREKTVMAAIARLRVMTIEVNPASSVRPKTFDFLCPIVSATAIFSSALCSSYFTSFTANPLFGNIYNGLVLGRHDIRRASCAAPNASRQHGATGTYNRIEMNRHI